MHADPAFRAARIREECGSITEPSLYRQCVESFNDQPPPAAAGAQLSLIGADYLSPSRQRTCRKNTSCTGRLTFCEIG